MKIEIINDTSQTQKQHAAFHQSFLKHLYFLRHFKLCAENFEIPNPQICHLSPLQSQKFAPKVLTCNIILDPNRFKNTCEIQI